MRLLLLLLLALPCYASTIVVQSHDITVAYGESLARSYDTHRLIKVRDFSTDVNDNTSLTLERIIAKTNKYDNLVVLGFNGTFNHKNVTVVPVFANMRNHSAKLLPIIKHFDPISPIHVLCNKICPELGTIHHINDTLHLRRTLLELNRDRVIVVNSLLSLYDNESQGYIFSKNISKEFERTNKNLDIAVLYDDRLAAITIWIPPENIVNGSYEPNVFVKVNRLNYLQQQHVIYNATQSIKLRVY